MLLWYAAWKHHTSLYPIGPDIVRAHPEMKGLETAKATVRFPLGKPPSATLLKKLVKARIARTRGT